LRKQARVANSKDEARARADTAFTASQQRDDAVKREIEKERNAIIAKSARLKALRLAKEEADREAARLNPPPEKKKRAPRKKALG
jgi:hypothetical protein